MKTGRRIMKAITATVITTVTGQGTIIRLPLPGMNRRTITNRVIKAIIPETTIITAIIITVTAITIRRMITVTKAESK